MNIVVLVKQVPDTYSERKLREQDGLIDRESSFGHVVVDEAQDLSAMQCRAISRRSEHGSVTVLGDLAQGTAAWAVRDWSVTLAHLGKPAARVVPLTTGFRVPHAVVELSNRLLPSLGVQVPPAVSLRRDGSLDVRAVSDVDGATVSEVRAALRFEGSIGVIAADAACDRLTEALHAEAHPAPARQGEEEHQEEDQREPAPAIDPIAAFRTFEAWYERERGQPFLAVFERYMRIHQNTMEQLVVFIPALWLFSMYMSAKVGALLGLVFIASRALYAVTYVSDPRTRTAGIASTGVVLIVLLGGAAIGAVKSLFE